MEQSTFLPPRYTPPENPKTMTDEKLRKEISDLQTENFHLQDRIEIKTHNTSYPPSEQHEEYMRSRWGPKDPHPKLGPAWADTEVPNTQTKQAERRLLQDSHKTSLALEHQAVKSIPATTSKVDPETMSSASISLPEPTKTKKSDFKIFDDETPKNKTVETNRAIHFALKKMGLSDLADIEGVSINPENGEVALETGSKLDLKLAAEDRKWLGAKTGSQSPLRNIITAEKIKKSATVSSYDWKSIEQKKWKVVSGKKHSEERIVVEKKLAELGLLRFKLNYGVIIGPTGDPSLITGSEMDDELKEKGIEWKGPRLESLEVALTAIDEKASRSPENTSTPLSDALAPQVSGTHRAVTEDPAAIPAGIIRKARAEEANIADESERDAKKKAEYAELKVIREMERQEALEMAGLQGCEGLLTRMEPYEEESRRLSEEAKAAALEAYNRAHASDKKSESKVEPGTSTAPSSVSDYFDHISRRERNKSIRTSQPLSRVSVPPQGYTVVKGSPLLHGKPSHVTLEHNTTTKHIGVPPESSSSAQASKRKTAIQRPINTGSYLPISRVFERRNMSNTHKALPKPSCPTLITPQPREYAAIREPFRQNVEQIRIPRAMNDNEIKLNDLKEFADSFKLHTTSTREPFTRPEISEHKTITSTVREISPRPTRRNPRQQKPKQIFLSEVDDEWQNMSNTIQLVPVDPAEQEWEDVDVNLDVNATTIKQVVEKESEVGEEWILVA
jgi:hypothetical protein